MLEMARRLLGMDRGFTEPMEVAPPLVAHAKIEAQLAVKFSAFEMAVDLHLPVKGVTVLLGHSGSGKTTLLRALAGLERAHGRVVVGGSTWQDDATGVWLAPHQRPIGYVFQEASLFAHLNVRGNLLYGMKRVPREARKLSVEQVCQLLGIEALLDRRPDKLSGGERQRVSIARALLTGPQLLLMDEPLSALDPARKAEILPYLERLNRETQVPVVYVTHALEEAARLADHVVLMAGGKVQAQGTIQELTSRLDTSLSRLDEAAAVIEAQVAAHAPEQGLSELGVNTTSGLVPLWVGLCHADLLRQVRVRILARDVSIALSRATDSSILNVLPAEVVALQAEGVGSVMVRLRVGQNTHLLARLTKRSVEALRLQPGMLVFAQVKGAALLG